MFVVNLNLYAPTGINNGPNITAIGEFSPGGKPAQQNSVAQLRVPWRDIAEQPNTSSFLSWHTAMSEFAGRDKELEELTAWAEDDRAVSARFIIGEGGTGKSRLGAEFAETLKKQGWEAGFLNIRTPQNIPMSKRGTLLLVDYPEENHTHVRDLLVALTELDKSQKIRVLFLTRAPWSEWEMRVGDCNAYDVVDLRPVQLGRLEGAVAHTLYTSTLEKVSDIEKTDPPPLSEAALNDWLNLASENDRALFIIAAAVHSALNPADEVVQYTGSKVMQSLVDRERHRLRRQAKDNGENDIDAYARLIAMTAISGNAHMEQVLSWVTNDELNIGIAYPILVQKHLEDALLLRSGVLPVPGPDLFAAAFAWTAFEKTPRTAPELVWAAIEPDVESGLDRLGRFCFDVEITLGMLDNKLGDWLVKAVDGKPERCEMLRVYLDETVIPMGLLETAVCIWKTLISETNNEFECANLYNSLSNHESNLGHFIEALDASLNSIKYIRQLASKNPLQYEPYLATSLNNLSTQYSYLGNTECALESIQESVNIWRKFTDTISPCNFATSLNNLSVCYSYAGNIDGALKIIKEAIDIRRILAMDNTASSLFDLSMSLHNLSNYLSDIDDAQGAMEAIREAVNIRRKLKRTNPARFLPELAQSLNNLSVHYSNMGDAKNALKVIQEVVPYYRKLAINNPARFLPELALCLNNLSSRLSNIGDIAGAFGASVEAVQINRKLADVHRNRFLPDLALCHGPLGEAFMQEGKLKEALAAYQEGAEIIKPFAEKYPGSPHDRLYQELLQDIERTKKMMG